MIGRLVGRLHSRACIDPIIIIALILVLILVRPGSCLSVLSRPYHVPCSIPSFCLHFKRSAPERVCWCGLDDDGGLGMLERG